MAGVYVCNNWCRGILGEIKSRMGGREREKKKREGGRKE